MPGDGREELKGVGGGVVVGGDERGLGNKRILLCHQRGSAPNSSPALWQQVFILFERGSDGWREGGMQQERLMVG